MDVVDETKNKTKTNQIVIMTQKTEKKTWFTSAKFKSNDEGIWFHAIGSRPTHSYTRNTFRAGQQAEALRYRVYYLALLLYYHVMFIKGYELVIIYIYKIFSWLHLQNKYYNVVYDNSVGKNCYTMVTLEIFLCQFDYWWYRSWLW